MPRQYISPNFLPFRLGYSAITLFPFGIYYRSDKVRDNQATRNHELIHWMQQKEMLGLFFYLWYLFEYLAKLIRYMNHRKAYRSIGFEKEAKKYEQDQDYLSGRKTFYWIRCVLR